MTTDSANISPSIGYHRDEAMAFSEEAEVLTETIESVEINSPQYRRINQRLSVALKLATVHAHLAVAVAVSEDA